MTNQSEICEICGQPKSSSMTGSFTQWVAACRCEQIDRAKGNLPICAICGKQIDKGNTGSFTQWALQSQSCSCETPIPLDPNMSSTATYALSDDAASLTKPIRRTVEEEIGDLGSDSFPLDRYKPIDKLGAGGGGAVYLCFDKHLRKNVAVKISFAKLNDELVNFQAEAKVTAKFQHPNIVSIIDFGLTPGGAPFMVLEHVDGVSLDKYILKNGHVEESVAIPLFVQVASALEKGHESGIFHRDMKSSNIIITHEGKRGEATARVIDFGIALMSGQETTKFHGKNIIGTPKYMSPDQLMGRTFDARSEIYSFGCVMYETLTGVLPFRGDALSLLDMHTNLVPPTFESVAPDVRVSSYMERLVRRCLEKDPELRFGSMKELTEALQRADGDDIIESSSVQSTIDPSLFEKSSNANSPESDAEVIARRMAFETESRKRALTDDMAIPGLQKDQIGQNTRDTDLHSKAKKTQFVMVLVAVVLGGALLGLGVLVLKPDSEPLKNISGSENEVHSQPSMAPATNSTADSAAEFGNIHDLDTLKEKAAILERSHRYKDAEAAYSRMVTLQPTTADFFRLRGLARKHQGKYAEAFCDLNEAFELHDIDCANIRARADYHLDCGDYLNALKDVDYALNLEPDKIDNLLLKARIMMVNQSPASEIEKVLNKAVKVSRESGLAFALRSQLYSQMKRPLDAEKDMDKAIEFSGNDPLVYYYRSVASSDTDHALLYMNQAIKFAPYMWQAYVGRGNLYARGKGEQQTIDDYEKAMAVNPRNAEICKIAALYYINKDHPREGRHAIDKAIKLDPQGLYYAIRAEASLHMGKHADAITDCENAIKAGHKGAEIYRCYGFALASQMRPKEAEAAFTKSLEYQPKFHNALVQRAQLYETMGKDQKALADYTAALKLKPDDYRCRQSRAQLYDRLGKPNLAARDRAQKKEYGTLFNNIREVYK